MTYDLMAGDLARLVGSCNLGTVSLAGHSMGGRTVMMAAVKQVIDIDRLIVLDISPVNQTFDVTSNNEWNMEHFFHCLKVGIGTRAVIEILRKILHFYAFRTLGSTSP